MWPPRPQRNQCFLQDDATSESLGSMLMPDSQMPKKIQMTDKEMPKDIQNPKSTTETKPKPLTV